MGMPIVPVRGAVVLPQAIAPIYVDDDRSRRAVEAAQRHDGLVVVVTQRAEQVESPGPFDLYAVGVEAIVEKTLPMPNGVLSVMLRGIRRVRISHFLATNPYLTAEIASVEERYEDSPDLTAQMRVSRQRFEQMVRNNPRLGEEAVNVVNNLHEPGQLADTIAMSLDLPVSTRQTILETFAVTERLSLVDQLLVKELAVLEIESRIQQSVQQEMDRGQKEYYLREQIKAIQRELSENDSLLGDGMDLRERILAAGMTTEAQERALREMERMESMPTMAPEYTVVRSYLDWLLSLPWKQETPDQFDLAAAAMILDSNHYGLQKIKDRLIEFIAVRKLAPGSRAPILCFVGPPGVGKTSLGRSIATALGRKFVRVSLGGVRDEAEIRGHRRTYVGAMPGRILQTMRLAATVNPVFVLDEIDKLASDYRGDPSSALLEVLDPEQNHAFSDHYLEVPYDLSKIIFVLTANTLTPIPSALLDRMEVIEVPGYTEEEKLQIARQFLLPKQIKDHGLSTTKVEVRDEAVRRVVREYTYEAGVRNLERELSGILRKVARRVAEGKRGKAIVSAQRVPEYLGPQHAFAHEAEETDQIGLSMGVAWTPAGGELTPVEIAILEGRGQILLTGKLGEVLRESAQAAISYARGRASELHLTPSFHEKNDIHIHLPMGAVPKDGPSAGVPIATALISALTGRTVRHDVAMTGEITLRGRVLPVGGVREKALAAYRAGLTALILPRKNLPDLEELTPEVREKLQIIPVDTLDDVLRIALSVQVVKPEGAKPTASDASATVRESNRESAIVADVNSEFVGDASRCNDKPNTIVGPTPREPQPPPARAIIGVN